MRDELPTATVIH